MHRLYYYGKDKEEEKKHHVYRWRNITMKKYWHFDWILSIWFFIIMPTEAKIYEPNVRSMRLRSNWIKVQLDFSVSVRSLFGHIFLFLFCSLPLLITCYIVISVFRLHQTSFQYLNDLFRWKSPNGDETSP